MPSLRHEVLVELFRQRPELARDLLRRCTGFAPVGQTAELASVDFAQIVSTEYRADAAVVFRDAAHRATEATVVEVQLSKDPRKIYTWPLYVAALFAKLECPIELLVVAPDPEVAMWAANPIAIGRGFYLAPSVMGFDQVPRVTDVATARATPELGVLSALAHRDLATARAAVSGIADLAEDERQLYFDVIMAALPAAVREHLESKMLKGYEYQSDFARRYVEQGRKEGREEGQDAFARDLFRSQFKARFGPMPPELEERVVTASLPELRAALERLVTADGAGDVFPS